MKKREIEQFWRSALKLVIFIWIIFILVALNSVFGFAVQDEAVVVFNQTHENATFGGEWIGVSVNNTAANLNESVVDTANFTLVNFHDNANVSMVLTETGANTSVFNASFFLNSSLSFDGHNDGMFFFDLDGDGNVSYLNFTTEDPVPSVYNVSVVNNTYYDSSFSNMTGMLMSGLDVTALWWDVFYNGTNVTSDFNISIDDSDGAFVLSNSMGFLDGSWSVSLCLVNVLGVPGCFDSIFWVRSGFPSILSLDPQYKEYTNDRVTVTAVLNDDSSVVSYQIKKTEPTTSSSGWTAMSQSGSSYSATVDFGEQSVGNFWLKLAWNGTEEVFLTSLVSAPFLEMVWDTSTRAALPGDTVSVDVFTKSKGFGSCVRMKASDWETSGAKQKIDTKGSTTLSGKVVDDVYDESVDCVDLTSSFSDFLVFKVFVPLNAVWKDYTSNWKVNLYNE